MSATVIFLYLLKKKCMQSFLFFIFICNLNANVHCSTFHVHFSLVTISLLDLADSYILIELVSFFSHIYWTSAPFLKHCHILLPQRPSMKIQHFCNSCHTGLPVQSLKLLSFLLLHIRDILVSWHMFLEYWNLILLTE